VGGSSGPNRTTRSPSGLKSALATEPRPPGVARLAGRDDFRIPVGDYRVAFAVDDDERLVIVARVAHRREVYRR